MHKRLFLVGLLALAACDSELAGLLGGGDKDSARRLTPVAQCQGRVSVRPVALPPLDSSCPASEAPGLDPTFFPPAVNFTLAGLLGMLRDVDGWLVFGRLGAGFGYRLFRLDANGLVDRSYGENGSYRTQFNGLLVRFRGDPVIVHRTRRSEEGTVALLTIFKVDGPPEERRIPLPIEPCVQDGFQAFHAVDAVAVDRRGRLLMAVEVQEGRACAQGLAPAVVRLDAEGELDASFGDRGMARLPRFFEQLYLPGLALDHAGRITVLVESVGPGVIYGLARLDDLGRRDGCFGAEGFLATSQELNGEARWSTLVTVPGGYMFAGTLNTANRSFALVVKARGGGGVDVGFGEGGALTFGEQPVLNRFWQNRVFALVPDHAGGVFAAARTAGTPEGARAVARIVGYGLDPTFGRGGLIELSTEVATDGAEVAALDSCGRLSFIGTQRPPAGTFNGPGPALVRRVNAPLP